MDIINLIDNNKWETIYDLIIHNKISLSNIISNGNNIVHLACINNNGNIIEWISSNKPKLLKKSNSDGNSCAHLLALYGHVINLKYCLKNNPELAFLTNNKDETILHLSFDNNKLFRWLLLNINLNVDAMTNSGLTPLTFNIQKTKNKNDEYFENIKLLIKKNANMSLPKKNPPLCLACELEKEFIVEYFIKNKNLIDCKNALYLTPLIISIQKQNVPITRLLLENNADINYCGPEGDQNPIIIAIKNNCIEIINLLLDHGIDLNIRDKFINVPLHIILKKKNFQKK